MLTTERAKELFTYDPETGVFTSKVDRGCFKAGDEIQPGYKNGNVWGFTIDGRTVSAMRLVLAMSCEEMNEPHVYADGDPFNLARKNIVKVRSFDSLDSKTAKEFFEIRRGVIRWIKSRGSNAKAGEMAGTIRPDGSTYIMFSGRYYSESHVAYLLLVGDVPKNCIVRRVPGKVLIDREHLKLVPAKSVRISDDEI